MQTIQPNYYRNMHRILEDFETKSSPQEICSSIVEGITTATRQKGCSLMLLTPDKKALFHSAAHGLSDWFVKKGPVIADRSIDETLKGNSVTILDAANDDRIFYRKQVCEEGIVSLLSTPVVLKGNILGVVRVYSGVLYQFNAEDISFVSMAASFGAAALENCGYYVTLQKNYEIYIGSMRQMRAELDFEYCCEPDVELMPDCCPKLPFTDNE
jgi:signal transduction protein with GAF and PtsI domain